MHYDPYQWKCPECSHVNNEQIDPELGPFIQVICENCQAWIDLDWSQSEGKV